MNIIKNFYLPIRVCSMFSGFLFMSSIKSIIARANSHIATKAPEIFCRELRKEHMSDSRENSLRHRYFSQRNLKNYKFSYIQIITFSYH